jgi:hypothetical protein
MLKENRFLLIGPIGILIVFTLFSAPLFSMTTFTREDGIIQVVDSNSYYFLRQASAQEGEIPREELLPEEIPMQNGRPQPGTN